MKTIWNIVSFLAVVHLLALATFAVWLWHSDRLDGARVQQVRELFSMTIPEAQVAAKRAQTQVKAELEERKEMAFRADPPFSSAAAIEIGSQVTRHTEQEIRRLEDAKQRRLAQLAESQRLFEEEEAASKARVELWEKTAAAEWKRQEDEQFAKAVKLLESQQPKQSKAMIVELVGAGKMDQAVAYINAMDERKSKKLIGAFKTPIEQKLATELLEQLRTFGLPADDPDDAGNADASPDTE
jgi:hypothetical protein